MTQSFGRSTSADVVVVGAGPAGSALATSLARAGVDVLALDRARFPRPKPCGEFVNPGAVAALERLELLAPVLARLPARIGGWSAQAETGPPASGRFPDGRSGLGIPRTELDTALVANARLVGARVSEGTLVTDARPRARGGWDVLVRPISDLGTGPRPTRIRCRYLVGAGGLRSNLARRLGAVRRGTAPPKLSLTCHVEGEGPDPGTGVLLLGDRTTIGLACTRAGGGRWNATVVVDPRDRGRDVARDPLGFFYRTLSRLPVPWRDGPSVVAGPWASGPFDWPSERIAGREHLFVGDASGYYDPLTGQGICRALRTVEIATPLILETLSSPVSAEKAAVEYERRVRRDRAGGRRVQQLIESTLRHDWSRQAAFRGLGAGPDRMSPLIRVTGDVAPPISLAHPRAWWPLVTPGRRIRADR